ncbi:helix-turn-helix domain-containing protein [Macellibacteroides fermentans]|uniref:helix-turn-helix domain-containing protein n=1 Tax=Macellibacteroides fermentans TaxID=879969 RepID=UPI00406CC658
MIKKEIKILEDNRLTEIGNQIRALRKANTNLSAEDFANEKGFDRVQYSRIENGANITMKTLLKVIDAHNISLSEFFSSFEF